MSDLTLSPQVFVIFNALIAERIGIHYDVENRDLLGDKLGARAAQAGFHSLLDYYYYLRYDPTSAAEMDALIDALVVGETYFFRELDSLKVAISDLVARRAALGHKLRIWSAACASGEEPLTIAMLLAERALLGEVELVASDVSQRALARARAGKFGSRALRAGVPPFAEGFLTTTDGEIVVSADLLGAIDWRRINLLDETAVASLGAFDVVVCRNVLIYFDDDTTRRVVDTLTAALRPEGALIVGVSESLLRLGTALECEEQGGVFIYRKGASR